MPVTRRLPPRANSLPTPRARSRYPSRNFMIRIILFLALIAAAAAGAAWVADQPGEVVLSWGGTRAKMELPVFVLLVGIGHGDVTMARRHADEARRIAGHDPLALLLTAQSAQMEGDSEGARRAF